MSHLIKIYAVFEFNKFISLVLKELYSIKVDGINSLLIFRKIVSLDV